VVTPVEIDICVSPVFVIGSPRSGTTALAFALGQHPDLATSSESQILVDLFFRNQGLDKNYSREGQSWLHKQGIPPEEFLADVGLGFNRLFTRVAGGKRWVDHTPRQTLMLQWLPAMFPGARFLHILRDGRRVVHSMVNFGALRAQQELPWWAGDFRKACKTWARFTTAALEYEAASPERCLTVRNEDLVADPVAGFRRVLGFIEAADHPAPAEYFAGHRLNSSFAATDEGSGAAGRTLTDPWADWDDERRGVFARVAGPTLLALGMAGPEELAPYGAG
jgi:hypothetical protein